MSETEPQTYQEAMQSHESNMWKEAIQKEIKALEENKTWEIVNENPQNKIIDTKWVFRKKGDSQD